MLYNTCFLTQNYLSLQNTLTQNIMNRKPKPNLKVAIAIAAVAFFVLCMSQCKDNNKNYVRKHRVQTVMA
jgi:hypothetical protein